MTFSYPGPEFVGKAGEYCVVKYPLFGEDCYVRGVSEGPDELRTGNVKINLIDYGISRSIDLDLCYPHVSLVDPDFQKSYGMAVKIPFYSGDTAAEEKFNELCGDEGFPCKVLNVGQNCEGELLEVVTEDMPEISEFIRNHLVSDIT